MVGDANELVESSRSASNATRASVGNVVQPCRVYNYYVVTGGGALTTLLPDDLCVPRMPHGATEVSLVNLVILLP